MGWKEWVWWVEVRGQRGAKRPAAPPHSRRTQPPLTLTLQPALALAALASRGATSAVFGGWVDMVGARRRGGGWRFFRRAHDKKVAALGLAAAGAVPVP